MKELLSFLASLACAALCSSAMSDTGGFAPPSGRCCLPDGACAEVTAAACAASGGVYGGDFSRCEVFFAEANNPNAFIPDLSFVEDSLVVSGAGANANDINVQVNLAHTFVSDLVITVHHLGTSVTLWNRSCGGNDNMNVLFDDEGAAVVCATPTAGIYIPNQALSAFDGMNPNGTWTLRIADQAGLDVGTLFSWSVEGSTVGNPCPQPGRCCFPDGSCADITADNCAAGGGSFGGEFTSCSESLAVFGGRMPNVFIPDLGSVVDSLDVSVGGNVAHDINIRVNLSHTFQGDLLITVSHQGRSVTLWNRRCGGLNNMNVLFDDEGAPVICAQPTTGIYIPSQALSAFDGLDPNGTWTLRIDDREGADVGTLHSWSVEGLADICPQPAGACCFSDGSCSEVTAEGCAAIGGSFGGDFTHCSESFSFSATDSPNVPIPDLSSVADSLAVSGLSGRAADINIRVNLAHTYLGDLVITIGHAGTSATLWSRQCGGNGNMNILFDDEGAPVICASPTTGVYIPSQALSVFDGLDPNGIWTLNIADQEGADVGTLMSWSVQGTSIDPLCPQVGRCCLPDGSCSVIIAEDCAANGGAFGGEFTNCDSSLSGTSSPNAFIPDSSFVEDSLEISGAGNMADDIDIRVNLSHSYLSDLLMTISHAGTSVTLWHGACGSNINMNILFDDEGAPIVCASPTIGTYVPGEALSAFDGMDLNGTWTLRIADEAGADVGTLHSWSVEGFAEPCPQTAGACCLSRCECVTLTETECAEQGGVFDGAGSECGGILDCVPSCPCDWNGFDGLDSQDFFDFLSDFFDANADFNCDGERDSQDYFEFNDCFFGGICDPF